MMKQHKNSFYDGEGRYQVDRFILRYGHEYDPMDCTTKYFDTEEKAIGYALRYARGLRFASAVVTDPEGYSIYEICEYGSKVYDNRQLPRA